MTCDILLKGLESECYAIVFWELMKFTVRLRSTISPYYPIERKKIVGQSNTCTWPHDHDKHFHISGEQLCRNDPCWLWTDPVLFKRLGRPLPNTGGAIPGATSPLSRALCGNREHTPTSSQGLTLHVEIPLTTCPESYVNWRIKKQEISNLTNRGLRILGSINISALGLIRSQKEWLHISCIYNANKV